MFMYVAIHMLLVSRLTDVNRVCQCGRTRRSEARVARSAPPRAAAPPRGPTGSSSATSPSDVTERARCDTFAWEGKGYARDPGGQRESRQNVQGDPLTPGRAATLPRASHCRDPCYFSFGGVCESFAACLNRATGQRQTFALTTCVSHHTKPPLGDPLQPDGPFFTHAPTRRPCPSSTHRTSKQPGKVVGRVWLHGLGPFDRPSSGLRAACLCVYVCVIAFLF